MNILHFFPPHIPLILVMSQYQFLLHVSHMYLINCRYGGVHWLVWCVRDNWLPSMGCSATSVSRGYGQCGASQEKDQILLHEPLWEVPRSRTKTLETPPADRQNCHYYHPGSILIFTIQIMTRKNTYTCQDVKHFIFISMVSKNYDLGEWNTFSASLHSF